MKSKGNEMEHTPKRWEVHQDIHGIAIYRVDSEQDLVDRICNVLPVCVYPSREPSADRTKANAELIAAAPELLQALRDLHDEQNGPPLIRRQASWEAAMAKAQELLTRLNG